MNRPNESPHFHIRWSRVTALDWECFKTFAEAEARAKELVRRDETYAIEERDETCPRCQTAFELKTDHTPAPKYAWQKAVVDASTESRPEYLAKKVNAAQRAISARLCEETPATSDEQIAIREALNFLRALVLEKAEREESRSRAKTA